MNKTLKEGLIKEAGIAAFKILVSTFKACELKTHIEQMFIDDETGEEFILKFYSKEGFDRFFKPNEPKVVSNNEQKKKVCIICEIPLVNPTEDDNCCDKCWLEA